MNKANIEALNNAKNLKSHENGVLTPIYQLNDGVVTYSGINYSNECSPAVIYKSMMVKPKNNGKYCITKKIESRENGDLKKLSECNDVLMYRKKYARKAMEVKAVSFDIVGLKRKSKNLPAGVIIKNVIFDI